VQSNENRNEKGSVGIDFVMFVVERIIGGLVDKVVDLSSSLGVA
jgi:hypothetical protein